MYEKTHHLRRIFLQTLLLTTAGLPSAFVRADTLDATGPGAGGSAPNTVVATTANASTNNNANNASNTRQLITLATQYEHAEGVPRDYEKAAALYCKAARLGDADAQFALGWMYANGRGVVRNDGVAAQIFSLAADRGHPAAKVMRGFTESAARAPLPACLLPDPPAQVSLSAPEISGPPMSASYFKGPIYNLVTRLADKSGIDPKLVMAVILVESGFNPRAQSPKNAQGLMQLIPETAQRFRVRDAFDPEENIKGGIAYLKWLLAYFKGDVSLVAAAYNSGEGTVQKYRGVPPYPETQKYVRRIAELYQKAMHPYESGPGKTSGARLPAARDAKPVDHPVLPVVPKPQATLPRVVASRSAGENGPIDVNGPVQPVRFALSTASGSHY